MLHSDSTMGKATKAICVQSGRLGATIVVARPVEACLQRIIAALLYRNECGTNSSNHNVNPNYKDEGTQT